MKITDYLAGAPLTIDAAVTLTALTGACQRNARVGWLGVGGDVLTGTMVSVGTEYGTPADPGADVRDCFLRVTTGPGDEYWPVPWAAEMYDAERLVLDYVPVNDAADIPAGS